VLSSSKYKIVIVTVEIPAAKQKEIIKNE